VKGIVLVGFMGAGKTAVSRELALRLTWPQVDTDALIVGRLHKPITQVFAEEGEAFFRNTETRVLEELAAVPQNRIIATGGGIVLADRNWPLLRQLGPVICLTADPDAIMRRVGTAQDRPLLAGTPEEVRTRIDALLQKREPYYRQADWTCDTSALTPGQVAEAILKWTNYSG